MNLAENLLAWYDRCRRDLPWRRDKDPYKIWVSEIMLQQTRVEAVKEYYRRWLERFPGPRELAAADEEEVLRYWQGLGYYNRARNLQAAMQEVCAAYNGQIPASEAALRALPGVGEYTAGAVLSIAFDQPQPAVDGNVLRIFSRLFYIAEDIGKTATKRRIAHLAARHISRERPGDFNQALMDLGSGICIPRTPRCSECPLAGGCEGYALDVQNTLPVKAPPKEPVPVTLAAGLIQRNGKYLIRRRGPGDVLAGMWEFPAAEVLVGRDEKTVLSEMLQAQLAQQVMVQERVLQYTHVFSHRKWLLSFYGCLWQSGEEVLSSDLQWISPRDWHQVVWAGPHAKAAKEIEGCIVS